MIQSIHRHHHHHHCRYLHQVVVCCAFFLRGFLFRGNWLDLAAAIKSSVSASEEESPSKSFLVDMFVDVGCE